MIATLRAATIAVGAVAVGIGPTSSAVAPSRAPVGATRSSVAPGTPLRVCADPNNLPFSDRAGRGFENRIATLVGRELHRPVTYYWWAQRRGFVRNTLSANRCDVIIGIVAQSELVLPTSPYYQSTYVFVTRANSGLRVSSFNDPRLRTLRVGIHVIGDDGNSLPPGVALAERGIIRNVVGYSIYGDYTKESPPSDLIRAVARGAVDVAVAWGPLAGYYAMHSPVPLVLQPVTSPAEVRGIPFTYPIAFGVRHGDVALQRQLNEIIARDGARLQAILRAYGVPVVGATSSLARTGPSPAGTAKRVATRPARRS